MIDVTLSHYRVTAKLGEGGMGEVWRAQDTRLGRDVAVKLLPADLAADAERTARFEREARVLASLSHPNIASVFDVGEADGRHFLVMELAEGETLADRLARGPLPLDEALEITGQIAAAMASAHDQGIVHRDLKPGNVMVTGDGAAKVLDFGLAKALGPDAASGSAPAPANSPTLTYQATMAGVLIGTAGYMSPEQAKGREADRRADVWALGCLLFEMLSGRRAFAGETVAESLAAVLRAEPPWDALPASTPPGIVRVLERCLAKDPGGRLRDVADVRLLLDEARHEPPPKATTSQPRRFTTAGWIVALGAAGVAALFAWRLAQPPPEAPLVWSSVRLPEATHLVLPDVPNLAISADGRQVAFSAVRPETSQRMIYVRRLDERNPRPLSLTERASSPIFSPNGQELAFFRDDELQKLPVTGGATFTLAKAPNHRGATWSPDGSTIYFSPEYSSGIWEVPTGGGHATPVIEPDRERGERTFRWPHIAPGGRFIVYTVGGTETPNTYDDARIEVVDLETRERHELFRGASFARFAGDDRLLLFRAGVLFAAAVDLDGPRLTSQPVPVLQGVGGDPSSGAAYFDLAEAGSLAFIPGGVSTNVAHLTLVGADGEATQLALDPDGYNHPRFSPDGTSLAFTIGRGQAAMDGNVWVYDLESEALDRLTFDADKLYPSWTRDGLGIAFTNADESALFLKPVDGSRSEALIFDQSASDDPRPLLSESWSPDGTLLAFTQIGPTTDVYLTDRSGEARLFQEDASSPAFSPDGRWIVFQSPASGDAFTYVRPVEGEGRWQLSPENASYPRWPRGDRIFFITTGQSSSRPLMSVSVESDGSRLQFGRPQVVLEDTTAFVTATAPQINWDAAPEGDRFAFVEVDRGLVTSSVEVALGWVPYSLGELP